MNKQTLEKLIVLQDALNEYITKNWKENRSELDFMIANHQEMAELIDTKVNIDGIDHQMGWKWWKGVAGEKTMELVDWDNLHPAVVDNIKIELTDLLFFTLSQKVLGDHTDPDEIVQLADNDWVNFMSISANNLLQRPGASLMLIIELAKKIDFNIVAYYCAKLTLNLVRQNQGYNNGTYQKVIDGIEDNELLHDVIKGITMEDLEKDFDNIADKIMTNTYKVFGMENSEDKFTIKSLRELVS